MTDKPVRRRALNVAVFIALEVASLCLLAYGSSVRQIWLGRWFTGIQARLWETADKLRQYGNLKDENKSISDENARLLAYALERNMSGGSCDSLWRGLRVHYSILPARIVTMTFRSQHNYLIVDRGFEDGVEQDDGIITPEGIIGVVTGVSRNFSYAVSFSNKDMAISARHMRSGIVGSLNWDGIQSNGAVFSGSPIHIDVCPGDTVCSSGFSSIFPSGIPLGTIGGNRNDNGSTADYSVTLFEDYRKISRVMIVKNLDREEINGLKDDQR